MDSLANPDLTYDPTTDIQGLIWTPWATLLCSIAPLWTFEAQHCLHFNPGLTYDTSINI